MILNPEPEAPATPYTHEGGFPRVSVPGADEEAVSFVQTLLGEAESHERHVRMQQRGMAAAMMLLGKPIFRGVRKPAKRPTKNVRHMARVAARSSAS